MDFQQIKAPGFPCSWVRFGHADNTCGGRRLLQTILWVAAASLRATTPPASSSPPWQQLKWQGLLWPVLCIVYSSAAERWAEMDGSSANLHDLKCQLGLMQSSWYILNSFRRKLNTSRSHYPGLRCTYVFIYLFIPSPRCFLERL